MKAIINPKYFEPPDAQTQKRFDLIYGPNPNSQDVLRQLEPYEQNNRCLKSIKMSLQP